MSKEAMKDMIKWDRPCYKCLSHYCDLSCKETLKQEPVAWRFQSSVGGWAYGKEPPKLKERNT